jgi:hypothetical protein
LKQVGSEQDSEELAKLLLYYWLGPKEDELDVVFDLVHSNILAILIDHEVQTHPDGASFANIMSLVQAKKIPVTLSRREDWHDFLDEHGYDEGQQDYFFGLVRKILWPFQNTVTIASDRKRRRQATSRGQRRGKPNTIYYP